MAHYCHETSFSLNLYLHPLDTQIYFVSVFVSLCVKKKKRDSQFQQWGMCRSKNSQTEITPRIKICFPSPRNSQKFLGFSFQMYATMGTSLVVQWLRIHLIMQGIQVRSLVWEDLTSHLTLRTCATTTNPKCLEPMLCNKGSHCNEKPAHCNKEQPSLQWRVAPATTRESPGAATKTQCGQK